MPAQNVVITGASGLLGRAAVTLFRNRGDNVTALAFTRADRDPSYTKLDLTDAPAVDAWFAANKVDTVVHCAAERRPDVAEANPEAAESINVAVPKHLGELAVKYSFKLLYISTDYVFDGRNPPYEVDAHPNPLQMYGRQKLAGEHATLAAREQGANAAALRVPVLYGRAEYDGESAVNILVAIVKDQSGKTYSMDDYQIRNPTNVEDVARVLYDLAHLTTPLPPVIHFISSGPDMTKWQMTQSIARVLNLPTSHITPASTKPEIKPGQTERPWNTKLSVKVLEELGIDTKEAKSFDDWWASYLTGGAATGSKAKRGALIVLEGLDRSGKSTQVERLVAKLNQTGPARLQKFPDRTTAIGQMINAYLQSTAELDDHAIHLLFAANRWECAAQIEKDLADGITIVCDRYAFSGIAFTAAKGLDFNYCLSPDTGLPLPDAAVFLTLSPEVAAQRGAYGQERYETLDTQKRVREQFALVGDEMGRRHPGRWVSVSAEGTVDQVEKAVWDAAQQGIQRASGGGEQLGRLWA